MLSSVLAICVAALLLHHFWTNRDLYRLSWIMPGPIPIPFLGNAYNLIGRSHEGLLEMLNKLVKDYPAPLMRYWMGTKMYVFIKKPEDLQVILTTPECLNRDDLYEYTKTLAGNGLLVLPVDAWKDHRKYLNPTFSLKILQSYIPIFNKETQTLVNRLRKFDGKPEFDIYQFMDACTLDIVCQTTMGSQMHIQKDQNIDYLEAANNLLSIITTRIFNPLLHVNSLFRLTKWYKIEQKSEKIVFGFVDKILQNKKRDYHVTPKEDDEQISFKSPQLYIDQLLKLSVEGGIFTDDDVKSESNTIISTGFESTALITSYCVLMLAMHPEIQEKVHKEVSEVVADPANVQYEELGDLKFTERVIKETMRLFPTVPVIGRVASAPFQLREFTIPANTHFLICLVTLHRDKAIWGPEADKFNPDNFLPEHFQTIHPYAYAPFSAGPRNCIGIKYAYMLMKVLLAQLVSSYKFRTHLRLSDLKHRIDITLKLNNKHMVSATARNKLGAMWAILVLLFLATLVWHLWSKRELYRLTLQMPGPFMIPLIGNYQTALGISNEGLLKLVQFLTTSFPTPVRWWVGTTMYVIAKKPDDLQVILNSPNCLSRADVYEFLRSFGGDGLVSLEEPQWKVHRKLLNPTFSLKILQTYMPIFNKEVKVLVSRLQELCNKPNPTDIYNYMDALTLDVVCQTTMGTEMHIQKNQNIEYLEAGNNLLSIITTRMFNPVLQWDWFFRLTSLHKVEKKSSDITFGFVDKILQRKKINYKAPEVNLDDDQPLKSPQIYIDQLMRLRMEERKFNDRDVVSEANTIVATGFESTALVSSYCILMLAMFPEHQERIYEEIKSIMPNREDNVQYDDFSKYEFLERFIKETMRLFPSVPLIARTATAPFQMGKYVIPKGTNIVCAISMMQRDKEVWGPNAAHFDPDHFLPENLEKMHPYAYLPFSGGPRNCIGIKYAYMFLRTIVIHLVSNFRFRTDLKMSDFRHRMDITFKLINKHMVYVEKRAEQ
ncbi:uncharacterized protein LOC132265248 [Phlebotomus argentipes]|uniref:uncharacterized protein LOC132265248 n=1 Tax=Phlebotomus argentipes TaxID=94469 RepID=UPI0028933A48|nr:uncharacterized protein LOC132265248 [Phlebotomus argentipes]